jgi:AcrR family transcriptional regulator
MRGVTTTRDALVEAAATLLEEGGIAAVTLREVGRRAGVSHNAPYKHFADKEDLLASVAARELRRRQATLRRARAGQPAVDVVGHRLRAFVHQALAHPELFRLTYGRWSKGSPELGAAAEAARSAFVELVIQAQGEGDLPAGDPERVTALLMAVARGACEMALSGHLARDGKGRANPTDLVDDLLAYLRAT